ncbi:site-2 protease family protein [Jannaschia aquimarina]|uniref:Zinc metalloprotease n=1 Tax=Jannaschia aquimarina TaxID=935700 RepID=A0A0D1D2M2_9RHOB|nr:site-2 protease family protein [Jannaschia aquimarina]KIT14318.1 putative zinc metalloprotease Rip3 [Jannaschia aquimarina]SNS85969.1 Zn-dependent protease (includes SpoIVFB) [Jannaschia aquimarina]
MWGRSISLGKIAGIDLRLDASWFLVAALLTWSLAAGYFPGLVPDQTPLRLFSAALIAMFGLFGSLILHEYAHALVARQHRMEVPAITLFLFGGVAELRTEPPNARAEFRVAIAGPLMSLAIAGVAMLLSRIGEAAGLSELPLAVLVYLAAANLLIAIFNMLPAFPLDGGRVFRSFLWSRSGDLTRATLTAGKVSSWIALGMIILGVLSILSGFGAGGLWPVLIGIFILTAAQATRSQVLLQDAVAGLSILDMEQRDPIVAAPDATLQEVVDDVMLRHALSYVPVVEEGVPVGEIDMAAIRGVERGLWATTRVGDVARPIGSEDVVSPGDDARELLDRMVRDGRRKFLVLDGRRLVGIVTLSDLFARSRMKAELSKPRG